MSLGLGGSMYEFMPLTKLFSSAIKQIIAINVRRETTESKTQYWLACDGCLHVYRIINRAERTSKFIIVIIYIFIISKDIQQSKV